MSLKDLIPAEFFIVPPPKPKTDHGKITICRTQPFVGAILVTWEKRCPIFKENLEAARSLKQQDFGTYRPECGGWVFKQRAVHKVLKAFPTLIVEDLVAKVAKMIKETAIETPKADNNTHGTITLKDNQWVVVFNMATMPRNQFGSYLNAARTIKANYIGSKGYNVGNKTWSFSRQAAAAIVKAFPGPVFAHSEALLADAKANPEKKIEVAKSEVVQDGYADTLLNLADKVLESY